MKKLLTIKHFQLFGLLVGAPVVFTILIISTIVLIGLPVTMLISIFQKLTIFIIFAIFGWFYTLGTNLHEKLPTSMPMNLPRFKMFLSIQVIYNLFMSTFIFSLTANGPTVEQPNPLIVAIVFLIPLFSMFCIFYCIYFSAKTLKAVELQRLVTFNDFVGEFFLFWFFPIGIWIIQPRINKLFKVKNQ